MALQMFSKAVGIDLGTTNSAVAVMNPTDTDIILHRDKVKRETTPSCVWKDPKNHEIVVGSAAFRRLGTLPSPIRSIKRLMGEQTTVMLTDEARTPEEISALILGEMKRQIEEDLARLSTDVARWIVDRAIITVPAYFDQPQIDATRRAGRNAGLEVIDLLHEPTAAACYHCWRTGVQNASFLVYDFGGGTFDVTVLRCTAGTFEVLGISGNKQLGGDDLDTAIAEHLQERLLADDYAMDLDVRRDPEDALRFQQLRLLGERVKIGLSTAGEYVLRDSSVRDKAGNTVVIDTLFERADIERVMRPIIERTMPYCFDALEQAAQKSNVALADIDAIILAGGSTHIPLAREMVRQNLCSGADGRELVADLRADQPRARCAEPVYEKVDTIVALGAAIRAAAIGGLAVYNADRTVRVAFRGTAATGKKEPNISGRVEALTPGIALDGGRVRLSVPEMGFDDEEELGPNGVFTFKKVPLHESAENLLSFDVYDAAGTLVGTAGRPVAHSREAVRPTGGGASTAVVSKPIRLEVTRAGKREVVELLPALTTLPNNKDFTFAHPGSTETVLINLYQAHRRIQQVKVPVPSSLPRGTLINLNLNVDELAFITVKGKIGDSPFEAQVEPPTDRAMPTPDDIATLDRKHEEALAYLPAGRRNVAQAKYKKAKEGFERAAARGDAAQALNEFEEMEGRVEELSTASVVLEPPKQAFDELVRDCEEMNRYAGQAAAAAGKAYEERDVAKSIAVFRETGEAAFTRHDQKTYSDCINGLQGIYEHAVKVARDYTAGKDERSDAEKAADLIDYCLQQVKKLRGIAEANDRQDTLNQLADAEHRLLTLQSEIAQSARGALEKAGRIRQELERMKNELMARPVAAADDGKLPEVV